MGVSLVCQSFVADGTYTITCAHNITKNLMRVRSYYMRADADSKIIKLSSLDQKTMEFLPHLQIVHDIATPHS